jgi:catechol 2,3-dioxygenase-like lactoylglutathione lyase family enzyme
MKVLSLNHAALHVTKAERSADFYRDFCGMEVIHSRTEADLTVKWVRLPSQKDGFMLVLLETLGELNVEPGNMDHLGFYVQDRASVDQIAEKARDAGILLEGPVYAGPVIGYYCMLQDPDGYILEFSCEQQKAE